MRIKNTSPPHLVHSVNSGEQEPDSDSNLIREEENG